jgi:arginine/lysine/ornithine decarboxylase
MDQSQAPLLDAPADYHRSVRCGFTPPGHRQGSGTDPRVLAPLGKDTFRNDLLATHGLDDRTARAKFLARAAELMVDATDATQLSSPPPVAITLRDSSAWLPDRTI